MAEVTRRIGLSLGADLCWPICFEEIIKQFDGRLKVGGDILSFEVERISIEPFDLRQPCRYDVVVDRLTHWYHLSREWIKKAVIADGLYVFNNPWSLQSMEKQTTYSAMLHLGLPIPPTWLVPPKEYEPSADLTSTLDRYARLFDLGEVGQKLGYPMYMKPYDGGGWVGVSRIDNEEALRAAYEQSGKHVMHLQRAVDDYTSFVRCVGVGPQIHFVNYDPEAPLHDRYRIDENFLSADDASLLEDMTLTINAFFGWDFNSCEALKNEDGWFPIDFANPCPDSQVTSLHWHFPWMVGAIVRWALYCAARRRPMRMNLDWRPFFEIADRDLPYRERLAAYAEIARERLAVKDFQRFCRRHLADLDQVIWDFFASDEARRAIREKVTALFPPAEVEEFTELFWSRVQQWRESHVPGQHGMKAWESWYSARVEEDINLVRWGGYGTPVFLFPTAGGDAEEAERFLMLDALAPLVDAGKIKIYACDSIPGRIITQGQSSPEHCSWILNRFHDAIYHEIVPAIRADCLSSDIEIIIAGASIGAFNALAALCCHPDVFKTAICLSGTFDLVRMLPHGMYTEDFYFVSPIHFLPNLGEGPQLEQLRRRFVLFATGQGRWEDPEQSWRMAQILGSKGIPNRVDPWGPEFDHDWSTWRQMLPQYLAELT